MSNLPPYDPWLARLPFGQPPGVWSARPGPGELVSCWFNRVAVADRPLVTHFSGGGYGLSCLLSGRGRYVDSAGREYALEPGSLFRFHGRSPRQMIYAGSSDFLECTLYLRHRIMRRLVDMGCIDLHQPPVLKTGAIETVTRDYLRLYRAFRAGTGHAHAQVVQLLVRVLEHGIPTARNLQDGDSVVGRFRELLDHDSAVRVPLPQLAIQAGGSYNELRARFKSAFGLSPGDYRIRRRIDAAKRLLETHTVQEAAFALGYPDPFSFSKQFRKQTGMAPSLFVAYLAKPRLARGT